MSSPTAAALAQPFLASDVVALVMGVFGLVYGLLWWRDRDPGMGWFALTW